MSTTIRRALGQVGQWFGVVLFAVALVLLTVEVDSRHWELIATTAAFVFTIATKVRYYGECLKRGPKTTIDELLKAEGKGNVVPYKHSYGEESKHAS